MSDQYAKNIFTTRSDKQHWFHLVRDGRVLCGIVLSSNDYQVSTQPFETRALCTRCKRHR